MSDPETTRLSMLLQAKDGSEAAWKRLFKTYQPWLVQWAISRGASEDVAEDAASEVLLTLVIYLPQFEYKKSGSFRAFLRKIFKQRINEIQRREAKAISNQESVFMETLVSPNGIESLLEGLIEHEKILKGRVAIASVQKEAREIDWQCWYLSEEEGLPAKEIAEELGISIGSVHVNKHRVKAKITEKLSLITQC